QFNRPLAHKIEQNLPNCSVLSLAWHSAATYAAASVDPSCFRGLQFPERDGPVTGFAMRVAESCGIGGEAVGGAERIVDARILAIDGATGSAVTWFLPAGPSWLSMAKSQNCKSSAPRRPTTGIHPALGRRLLAVASRSGPPPSAQSDFGPPGAGRARS